MRRGFARALGAILVLAMAGLSGGAQPSAPPGFLVQFEWQMVDPLFGGLSAIDVTDDGLGLTVLSDSGAFATGTIARDKGGQITNIALAPFRRLKGLGEDPLAIGRDDSEGLAIDAQGAVYISFEGVARVLRYADLAGSAQNLPIPAEFKKLQSNSALEALAIDGDGVLYTIPERSGSTRRPFPVFRFQNGVWDQKLSLRREGGFMPVGADFGPDGQLYILLRQFHGLAGFSSRLIRMSVGEDSLGPPQVMIESPVGYHSNLEGVSIWRDGAGHLRATMIADNNYLPFLPNAIVEYQLPD